METSGEKCTVTFFNNENIPSREIEQIFANFSKSVEIREYNGRIFVQFAKEEEAAYAMNCLKKLLKLEYAKKRVLRDNGNKSNDDNGVSYLENTPLHENCSDDSQSKYSSYAKHTLKANTTETRNKMQSVENLQNPYDSTKLSSSGSISVTSVISKYFPDQGSAMLESVKSCNTDDSSLSSDTIDSATLIDIKSIQKMYPIILANLPGTFTLEDVLNLVEECEPMALTEFHQTKGNRLKFCEIYLKSLEDVVYLKKKLDRFVIGGKKLMAIEPSECLIGAKWIF